MPAERCAVIGFVETNSVAYAAGLRPGDEILSVNGLPVANWQEVLQENAMGDTAQMEVKTPTGNLSVALQTERSVLGFDGRACAKSACVGLWQSSRIPPLRARACARET